MHELGATRSKYIVCRTKLLPFPINLYLQLQIQLIRKSQEKRKTNHGLNALSYEDNPKKCLIHEKKKRPGQYLKSDQTTGSEKRQETFNLHK